ncbi:hypothetical protein T440DRAFT_463170 [Plenodomus tracheiphilus IPT5]|uniref:Uncharacterized protein n=1 Tax=Plenodomus tracheiphilus IPT5 TaxID=1408161 RepID=A0A6A7BNG9_9PLEO|nr:hypothetical protein T440DRAFT_463170 [Plenodomus tracheiphilus IPT5]
MAPLTSIHKNLPSPLSAILTNIHKRSSSCAYYDSSCSDTHRLIVLIIILFVGFVVSLIFTLVYFRNRKRRIIRERQARAARDAMNLRKENEAFQGLAWQSPPPYMPRRPESAARVWR